MPQSRASDEQALPLIASDSRKNLSARIAVSVCRKLSGRAASFQQSMRQAEGFEIHCRCKDAIGCRPLGEQRQLNRL
jgi:hypothetical protein